MAHLGRTNVENIHDTFIYHTMLICHNSTFVCPIKISHKHCLQFILGCTVIQKKIENKQNLWGMGNQNAL